MGALDGTTIRVAFIGDEEMPGGPVEVVRRALVEAAKASDVALGFEGAVGRHNATVARRGFSSWTLSTRGKQGHSGQIFSDSYGSGAIYEAARILNSFHEEVKGEEYLTLNPGAIVGGTTISYDAATSQGTAFGKTNVIAQTATVEGDLRFISEGQKARVRAKMRDVVARSLPGTSAEIAFEDSYPAMEPKPGNYELLRILDQVSQAVEHDCALAGRQLRPSRLREGFLSSAHSPVHLLTSAGGNPGDRDTRTGIDHW